jgi:phage terminase large subunit GpA-like protein
MTRQNASKRLKLSSQQCAKTSADRFSPTQNFSYAAKPAKTCSDATSPPASAPRCTPAKPTSARAKRALCSLLARLRLPEELGFVEWTEREIVLPSDVAAAPGRLRLTKPQRGVAEALDDPAFERVSIMKSARVGASTLLVSLVGYWATRDPGPIGYLQPRDADARDFMTSEFEAIMDASPCLRDVFRYEAFGRNRRRGNLTTRFFPGGSLRTLAARSPRNLRRITRRYLIADETEGYESDPKEGDLVLLRSAGPCRFRTGGSSRCRRRSSTRRHKRQMVDAGAWVATHPEI